MFFVELADNSRLRGIPPDLPSPASALNYIAYEQSAECRRRADEQRRFWTQVLRTVERIPLARRASGMTARRHAGRVLRQRFSPDRLAALQGVSRSAGTTLFATLFSAFGVLIARCLRAADFGVGTVFANRRHPAAESVVASLANAVVLPVHYRPGRDFGDLLRESTETLLAAAEHQEFPVLTLDEWRGAPGSSATDLVDVMFILNHSWRGAIHLPDLDVTPLDVHNGARYFRDSFGRRRRRPAVSGSPRRNVSGEIRAPLPGLQIFWRGRVTARLDECLLIGIRPIPGGIRRNGEAPRSAARGRRIQAPGTAAT